MYCLLGLDTITHFDDEDNDSLHEELQAKTKYNS